MMEIKSLSLSIDQDDNIQWDVHFDSVKRKVIFRKINLEDNNYYVVIDFDKTTVGWAILLLLVVSFQPVFHGFHRHLS